MSSPNTFPSFACHRAAGVFLFPCVDFPTNGVPRYCCVWLVGAVYSQRASHPSFHGVQILNFAEGRPRDRSIRVFSTRGNFRLSLERSFREIGQSFNCGPIFLSDSLAALVTVWWVSDFRGTYLGQTATYIPAPLGESPSSSLYPSSLFLTTSHGLVSLRPACVPSASICPSQLPPSSPYMRALTVPVRRASAPGETRPDKTSAGGSWPLSGARSRGLPSAGSRGLETAS